MAAVNNLAPSVVKFIDSKTGCRRETFVFRAVFEYERGHEESEIHAMKYFFWYCNDDFFMLKICGKWPSEDMNKYEGHSSLLWHHQSVQWPAVPVKKDLSLEYSLLQSGHSSPKAVPMGHCNWKAVRWAQSSCVISNSYERFQYSNCLQLPTTLSLSVLPDRYKLKGSTRTYIIETVQTKRKLHLLAAFRLLIATKFNKSLESSNKHSQVSCSYTLQNFTKPRVSTSRGCNDIFQMITLNQNTFSAYQKFVSCSCEDRDKISKID